MNRRGFLSGILLACAAPAIVRADSLMRIVPLDTTILAARPILDVQKIIADMEASDALAAGLQLREWSAMDIRTGLRITRWDVTAENNVGEWSQHGIDMRLPGAPTDKDRALARKMLAGSLQQEGLKPTRDRLVLPEGARFI